MSSSKPALRQTPLLDPSSTLILVTGASGHIASNIVREALDLGYHVRGTARSQEKCDKTVKEQNHHPNYSTTVVPDFAQPSPEIDAAVRGVDSVIHVASDMSFADNAESIISSVVAGTENFLRAAAREPRVRRFTLTSSSTAALLVKPGVEGIVVTPDTWNDEAVDAARNRKGESIGPNNPGFIVYAASKTEGERAMWRFVEREKPSFTANAILPNFNIGRVIGSTGASGGLAITVLKEGRRSIKQQYYIDVIDDARLHLCAAVLDGSLKNERIFAFSKSFNMNDLIEVIKKVRPDADHSKMQIDPEEPRDLSKIPNEPGAELLRKWYGQDGYKSLEQSVRENLEGI